MWFLGFKTRVYVLLINLVFHSSQAQQLVLKILMDVSPGASVSGICEIGSNETPVVSQTDNQPEEEGEEECGWFQRYQEFAVHELPYVIISSLL